ncbi:MAG: hypothetical protein FJ296_05670, partial [Planctomycetes bacterium]|nr:hypothetical protein [Planctomycetota bacterium]
MTHDLRLGLPGFTPADLHDPAGLARLFATFRERLHQADAGLAQRYGQWLDGAALPAKEESELLVAVGRHVSALLVDLFGIRREAEAHRARVAEQRRRFDFRKRFVARRAKAAAAAGDALPA